MCRMSGFLHLIVPAERFRLLSGHEHLVEYTFNTGVARHRFCRRVRNQELLHPALEP